MKKILISILLLISVHSVFSQMQAALPPCPDKTCLWGCGLPIKEVLNGFAGDTLYKSEFVFEGRVLVDSQFCFNDYPYAYHRVLVLKEFKGIFTSDTIELAHVCMNVHCKHQTMGDYFIPDIHSGVEGIFFIGELHIKDFDIPFISLATIGCGFVNVCDKKDVAKEVYEPIEAATGQKYIEVHPNICATQKKQK